MHSVVGRRLAQACLNCSASATTGSKDALVACSTGSRFLSISPVTSQRSNGSDSTTKVTEYPSNRSITPMFVNNRNPRNLEKLRIAERAHGWELDKPVRNYWNKLSLELTGKHITAKIVHVMGRIPISASTNEWCIKKYLYSTRDASAAKAVGEVLAHRCLQAGITEISCFATEEERKKEKIALILTALEEGGVSLEEPDQIQIPWALNYPYMPEKSWDIYENIDDKLEEANTLSKFTKKSKS